MDFTEQQIVELKDQNKDFKRIKSLTNLGPSSTVKNTDGTKVEIFKKRKKENGLTEVARSIFNAVLPSITEDRVKTILSSIVTGIKAPVETLLPKNPTDEDLLALVDLAGKESSLKEKQMVTTLKDDKSLDKKLKDLIKRAGETIDESRLSREKPDEVVTVPPKIVNSFDKPMQVKEQKQMTLEDKDAPLQTEEQKAEDVIKQLEQIKEQKAEDLLIIDNKIISKSSLEDQARHEQAIVEYTEQQIEQTEQHEQSNELIPHTERVPLTEAELSMQVNHDIHKKHLQETLEYEFTSEAEVKSNEKISSPLQLVDAEGNVVSQVEESDVNSAVGVEESPEVATETDTQQTPGELQPVEETGEPTSVETEQTTEPTQFYTGSTRRDHSTPYVALHIDSIGIFFGSSTQPQWDDSLLRDRVQRFKDVPLEDLRAPFLQQNRSLFGMYGEKMLIYELKGDESSPIEMVAKENFEILQLYNSLKKIKSRFPVAGVPLSQLLSLGNSAAASSKPPVTDPPKDFDPNKTENGSGSGRLGPVGDLESTVLGSEKKLSLAQKVILKGMAPASSNQRQLYNKTRKSLAPSISKNVYFNPLASKMSGFNQSDSRAVRYTPYKLNPSKFQEKKQSKTNWAK